jgi:hypothetical protein
MSHARRREVAIDIADRIGRAADDGAAVTISETNGFQSPVLVWE